jgi:hypothetical protein
MDTQSVVFCLKSSAGRELRTFTVPAAQEAEFVTKIHEDEPRIREELGEKDPLRLIKISRCF